MGRRRQPPRATAPDRTPVLCVRSITAHVAERLDVLAAQPGQFQDAAYRRAAAEQITRAVLALAQGFREAPRADCDDAEPHPF